MTFLVVDDNRDTITLITQMLRGFGVGNVDNARDAPSALDILRSKPIDLIICDWQMKPVDGIKFTQLVRRAPDSTNPFVPIIMVTAYGEPELVCEARDSGVNEFLVKPVAPATLLSRIVSVLAAPRDFVETQEFFGPDRRRKSESYRGTERRKALPEVAPRDDEAEPPSAHTSDDRASGSNELQELSHPDESRDKV